MNKYMITITVPSKDKTFSSAILQIGPGGVTVSCPKESGIEVTQLRRNSGFAETGLCGLNSQHIC